MFDEVDASRQLWANDISLNITLALHTEINFNQPSLNYFKGDCVIEINDHGCCFDWSCSSL